MPIQKSTISPEKGFTLVQNSFLRDKSLSLKAKGLMTVLISLPPDWQITVKGLGEVCAENKDTISSILKELIERGYLRRVQERNGGKFAAAVYELIFDEQQKSSSESEEDCLPCDKCESNVIELASVSSFFGSESSVSEETVSEDFGSEDLGTNKYIYNKYIYNKYYNNKSLNHSYANAEMSDGLNDYANMLIRVNNQIRSEALIEVHHQELVQGVVTLIADTLMYQHMPVQIDGMLVPAHRIREAFAVLDYFMVDEVLKSIKDAAQEVMNMRAYLLTCLYRKATLVGAEEQLAVNRMFG